MADTSATISHAEACPICQQAAGTAKGHAHTFVRISKPGALLAFRIEAASSEPDELILLEQSIVTELETHFPGQHFIVRPFVYVGRNTGNHLTSLDEFTPKIYGAYEVV